MTLSRRTVTLLLLLILLLAAFFRFWRLEQMPPGLYHDEAYNGLDALSLVQGKTFPQFYEGWELYQQDAHAERPANETRWPIFFEGNYGREPFHIYLMALSIKLFGPTPFAIRAVPALSGTLAVLTTFLAAKALLGIRDWRLEIGDWRLEIGAENQTPTSAPPAANPELPITDHRSPLTVHYSQFTILTPLIAAFSVAILFPAIHFSRFGLRAMLFVPVETLAVTFFWKGLNSVQCSVFSLQSSGTNDPSANTTHYALRTTLYFLLSGLLLGLGLYIYAAARLFPLLFVGFVIVLLWRERPLLKQIWRGLAIMAGTAFIVALPLLIFFWQYPYFFVFRIAYVSNKGKGVVEGRPYLTWLQNSGRVIAGLFWHGETHLRHNLPGRPYLDIIQAIFFIVGLVRSAHYVFRKSLHTTHYALRTTFLLLWLAVMLLPTIMSGDAPHFGRMTGALPVIAIFIGLGFEWIGKQLSVFSIEYSGNSKRTLKTENWLLLTLLLFSALWTATDYFIPYANHPQIAADFYLPEWQMGQFAAEMPADASIYLTPTQEELATLYFALANPERLQNVAGGALPVGVPGREVLYLLRSSQTQFLAQLQAAFPNGRVGQTTKTYIPFTLPADTPRNLSQTVSSHPFANQIELAGWTLNEDNGALNVTLTWQAAANMETDYTAFVQLIGTDGQPVTQLDRQPAGHPTSNWQPGEMISDTYTIPLPPDLPPGTYMLISGFYDLPTLTPLGDTAVLQTWEIQ